MIQTCACQLVCTFHTWRGVNIQERSLSLFPHLGGVHSLRTSALLSLSRTVSHVLHAWHSCKGSRCHLSSFSRFSSGEGKVKGVWGRVLNRSFHPWISLDSFWVGLSYKNGGDLFPSVSQSRAQAGNTASCWHLQQLKNSVQRLLTLPQRGISCEAGRKQSWNVLRGKFNFDVYMGLNRKGDWGRDHAHPSTGMVSQSRVMLTCLSSSHMYNFYGSQAMSP